MPVYGKKSPTAGDVTKLTDTPVPAGKQRVVVIGACNRTANPAKISIAYSTAATAAGVQDIDWKTFDKPLGGNGEYERTHQLLTANEHVYVKSNIAGVNFDVRGYEGNE